MKHHSLLVGIRIPRDNASDQMLGKNALIINRPFIEELFNGAAITAIQNNQELSSFDIPNPLKAVKY